MSLAHPYICTFMFRASCYNLQVTQDEMWHKQIGIEINFTQMKKEVIEN